MSVITETLFLGRDCSLLIQGPYEQALQWANSWFQPGTYMIQTKPTVSLLFSSGKVHLVKL
jgi:hypothetical protein